MCIYLYPSFYSSFPLDKEFSRYRSKAASRTGRSINSHRILVCSSEILKSSLGLITQIGTALDVSCSVKNPRANFPPLLHTSRSTSGTFIRPGLPRLRASQALVRSRFLRGGEATERSESKTRDSGSSCASLITFVIIMTC